MAGIALKMHSSKGKGGLLKNREKHPREQAHSKTTSLHKSFLFLPVI